MRPHFIMGAYLLFAIGTVLACLSSGRWLLNGEMDILNALASFNAVGVESGGLWTVPKGLATYWSAVITALSWDYPFLSLSYGWTLFPLLILWAISWGVVFGFVQMALTVVQGIIGSVRTLIAGV